MAQWPSGRTLTDSYTLFGSIKFIQNKKPMTYLDNNSGLSAGLGRLLFKSNPLQLQCSLKSVISSIIPLQHFKSKVRDYFQLLLDYI